MKRSEAEKLGDALSKHLIEHIKEHGNLDMGVHVMCGDKIRALKGFDPNSGQQKAVVAELARFLSRKYKAECIILSAESYAAASEASTEDLKDLNRYREEHGTIEGHPLTREAVFLVIETPEFDVVRCYPFTRDEDGNVDKILDPMVFPDEGKMDGTLANMMKPEKRLDVPDSVLAEMEKVAVDVIASKAMGIPPKNDQGHTLH